MTRHGSRRDRVSAGRDTDGDHQDEAHPDQPGPGQRREVHLEGEWGEGSVPGACGHHVEAEQQPGPQIHVRIHARDI